MKHNGRRFLLVAQIGGPGSAIAVSQAFTVVSSRLEIIRKTFPQPVFNDNKGDKFLHLPVQLLNAAGSVIRDRVVPLKVTLRYCNGELVKPTYEEKPTLMQLQPDNPQVEKDGNCVVRARIMQITRNHNNNHFLIRIEPDLDVNPANCDIGYAECGPFEVRTKLVESESSKRKATSALASTKVKRTVYPPNSSLRTPDTQPALFTPCFEPANSSILDEGNKSNGIVQQFDKFVSRLQNLKWRPCGYDTILTATGDIERTKRMYFQPPNPNDFINFIMKQYVTLVFMFLISLGMKMNCDRYCPGSRSRSL